jgi:two-component system NtrC family sensor kinase
MTDNFTHIHPIFVLFFLYGAAFMFMGFSIVVKDMKESDLRISDNLWLLGMFGFTHGVREWLELYPLIEGDHLSLARIFGVKAFSLAMMIISFLFLLQFGLSLFDGRTRRWSKWIIGIVTALFSIWAIFIWSRDHGASMRFLRQIEICARNTLGVAGGLLTAYGLIAYSGEIKNLSNSISRNIFKAGIAFALYGAFSSHYFSTIAYYHLVVPAEVFRGGAAVFITFFIIKALNIFNIETRMRIEQQTRHLVQTEKLTSLGQLAAGIAHEINNPLTNASLGIQTLKGKLRGGIAEKELADKLEAVERNIDRASTIAQELLQFSRQRESEFIPIDINTVIKRSLILMKHKLSSVVVEQDLSLVPEVMGDLGKLEQVFINIVANAVDALPKGGRISISTKLRKGMIEASIIDTGRGITEENLSRLFDPFYTTKEIGSGTGLGLSICYGIIHQHRGSIKVSSAIGQGTTVTIEIPSKA